MKKKIVFVIEAVFDDGLETIETTSKRKLAQVVSDFLNRDPYTIVRVTVKK